MVICEGITYYIVCCNKSVNLVYSKCLIEVKIEKYIICFVWTAEKNSQMTENDQRVGQHLDENLWTIKTQERAPCRTEQFTEKVENLKKLVEH